MTKTELEARVAELEEMNAALNVRLDNAKVAHRELLAKLPHKKLSRMEIVSEHASKEDLLAVYGENVSKYVVVQKDGVLQACLKRWD